MWLYPAPCFSQSVSQRGERKLHVDGMCAFSALLIRVIELVCTCGVGLRLTQTSVLKLGPRVHETDRGGGEGSRGAGEEWRTQLGHLPVARKQATRWWLCWTILLAVAAAAAERLWWYWDWRHWWLWWSLLHWTTWCCCKLVAAAADERWRQGSDLHGVWQADPSSKACGVSADSQRGRESGSQSTEVGQWLRMRGWSEVELYAARVSEWEVGRGYHSVSVGRHAVGLRSSRQACDVPLLSYWSTSERTLPADNYCNSRNGWFSSLCLTCFFRVCNSVSRQENHRLTVSPTGHGHQVTNSDIHAYPLNLTFGDW